MRNGSVKAMIAKEFGVTEDKVSVGYELTSICNLKDNIDTNMTTDVDCFTVDVEGDTYLVHVAITRHK